VRAQVCSPPAAILVNRVVPEEACTALDVSGVVWIPN
jgi:hypothetical protein